MKNSIALPANDRNDFLSEEMYKNSLKLLDSAPELTVSRIQKELVCSYGSASRIIKRLISENLIVPSDRDGLFTPFKQ